MNFSNMNKQDQEIDMDVEFQFDPADFGIDEHGNEIPPLDSDCDPYADPDSDSDSESISKHDTPTTKTAATDWLQTYFESDPIEFKLKPQKCVISHTNVYEHGPLLKQRLDALLRQKENMLRIDTYIDRDGVERTYENERNQLLQYRDLYDEETKSFIIQYDKKANSIGRATVKSALGLTAFRKAVRDTLIEGIYSDFDLSNAHFLILIQVCKSLRIPCQLVQQYDEGREKLLEELQKELGVDRKAIKSHIISYAFGGSFKKFQHEHNLWHKAQPKFLANIATEINGIAKELEKTNCHLNKIIDDKINLKKKKLQKAKAELDDVNTQLQQNPSKLLQKKQKEVASRVGKLNFEVGNFSGSFLGHYLQELEYQIISRLIVQLKKMGLCSLPGNPHINDCFIYEYDGLKLLKQNVEEFGTPDELIEFMQYYVKERCNMDMVFCEKPIQSYFDLSEWMTDEARIKYPVCTEDEMKTASKSNSIADLKNAKKRKRDEFEQSGNDFIEYADVEREFNKTHLKITELAKYCKMTTDGPIMFNRHDFNVANNHLIYHEQVITKMGPQIETKCFIDKWERKNPNQPIKRTIGVYPPGGKACPEDVLNLWTPFICEQYDMPSNDDDDQLGFNSAEDLALILKHISICCNHDEMMKEYLIKWIALLLQYPALKNQACVVLIGDQGSGKGTLAALIKAFIGSKKYFESGKPSRDVFGDFNGQMANAYFVLLDEINQKDTAQAEDYLKNLITSSTIHINKKGQSCYEIESYHRFMIATNNHKPIKIDRSNRRFCVIRTSDEMTRFRGTEYYNKLYAIIQNPQRIKRIYEWFKEPERDCKSIIGAPIPITEHCLSLMEDSEDHLVTFFKSWAEQFVNDSTLDGFSFPDLTNGRRYNTDALARAYDSYLSIVIFNRTDDNIKNSRKSMFTRLQRLALGLPGLSLSRTKTGGCSMWIIEMNLIAKYYEISPFKNEDASEDEFESESDADFE